MTMQRAAVEIAPTSSLAHRELGTTFLELGLVPQAASALSQSIDLRPTRVGYQRLLETSRRMGDAETSRQCTAALNDPSLPSGIAIKTMAPDAFASSYRPDPTRFNAANQGEAQSNTTQQPNSNQPTRSTTQESRVSTKSAFPMRRR